MDRVRKGCPTLPRSKNLAIGEQIPFTGVCAGKQYVPGNPNPEELTNFVLAAPIGLVLDHGKNTLCSCEMVKSLGVGGAAVTRLSVQRNTSLFVRYFTSILLIDDLRKKEKYIACMGTIMKSSPKCSSSYR